MRLSSPFLLRTFDPPIMETYGKIVVGVERLGKRILVALQDDLYLIFHLMIAGRFRWHDAGARVPGKVGLGAFDFSSGTLVMIEASAKKRASLHVVHGAAKLAEHNPGGLEVLECHSQSFAARLRSENHTLKRALTSPRLFSGIGNAYSDEILFDAQIYPFRKRKSLSDEELQRILDSSRSVVEDAIPILRKRMADNIHVKVRDFLKVHNKGGDPCPRCGHQISEITANKRITSYCRQCQPGMLLRN